MPARTIYLRDKEIWKRIQRIAASQNIPASTLVEKLMVEFVENHVEPEVCPTCGQLIPQKDEE